MNWDQWIFFRCPLCDSWLEGTASDIGTCTCPKGHYRWQGRGSYACETFIIIDGKEERFYLDEGWGDEAKFEKRVDELREQMKAG